MRKVWLVCLLWLAGMCAACAQTAQSAEDAFRDSIMNKSFVLRNFSAETEIGATLTGSELKFNLPRWHALGLFSVKSVQFKNNSIEIDCTRQILIRKKDDTLVPSGIPEPTSIVIGLSSASVTSLTGLKEELFFEDVNDAVPAIPKQVQEYIPGPAKKRSKLPECDCAARDTDACVGHSPARGVTPGRLLRMGTANYPAEAKAARWTGTVPVAIVIDKAGDASDVWITRSVGMGLDEAAAQAARQFAFVPPACHAEPMEMTIQIEMNFH